MTKIYRVGRKQTEFVELIANINSGVVDTVSATLDIRKVVSIYISAKESTGDMASAEILLQMSPDDVNWSDSPHSLVFAAESFLDKNNLPISACYIRLKVKVKSAIASTSDIILQGK